MSAGRRAFWFFGYTALQAVVWGLLASAISRWASLSFVDALVFLLVGEVWGQKSSKFVQDLAASEVVARFKAGWQEPRK